MVAAVFAGVSNGCTAQRLTSGGAKACTLSSTWETEQILGDATTGVWSSGGLAKSSSGDLYLSAATYDVTFEGPVHLYKHNGTSFVSLDSWQAAAGRYAYPWGTVVDGSGIVWIVVSEMLPNGTDGYFVLLKYASATGLEEVDRYQLGGQATAVTAAVARDSELWVSGWVTTASGNAHTVVWRYVDGVRQNEFELDTSGGLANSQGWSTGISVAPNGKIWVASQYEDAGDAEHAEIFEGDENGFTQILDHNEAVVVGDSLNGFAFDSSGGFVSPYNIWNGTDYIWGIGIGQVSDPSSSFAVTQSPTLLADGTGGEYASRVLVHSSGKVFMGGAAYDADSLPHAIVHVLDGTTLTLSDQYSATGATADYWQNVMSLFEDSEGNVWANIESYDFNTWLPTYAVLRKLPCE